jgi:phosphatidylinositol alpha-1,6-mannosyltransferase
MTGACGLCGGIARANRNVLQALVEISDEHNRPLTVLSLLEQPGDRPPLPEGARFHAFAGSKRKFSLALLRACASRPLICFDHVTLALPVLPLAAAGVVKTVIFAHGSEAWKRVRRSSRWSFRYAALTLTNSDFTLRKMKSRLGRFRGAACPLGLSPDFRLSGGSPPGGPAPELEAVDGHRRALGGRVLLLVARLDPREGEKGHAELIDVLPRLLEEFPDVQLVCPGPGDGRRSLEARAGQNRVAHAVFLPGLVTGEALEDLYRRCYAFVMPSRQEGFGLVYLEAMNYARPCVGCYDDGAEDVIVPGETGLLVRDPRDTEEVLGILRSLLKDAEEARRLGENGLRRLHAQFTAAHHQERVRECLEQVL